jgi:5-methylcytosine-specific restriction endonuclease McrA
MSRLNHKKGRKSNYVKNNVNSEPHKEARLQCLKRDNYKCKVCGSTKELEMHHISYHIVGKELENLKWLVILCSDCHQLAHSQIDNIYNPKNPFKKPIL